jgi:2-polyprenyl-3-methyl-5-hydroxy-6-metoxy-1,4-benzoquinol methylase
MVQRVKKNLKSFYEEEAKRLTSHQDLMYVKGNKHELWWHRKRFRYIISFLSEIFRRNEVKTFLDAGCAEGYYVKVVAETQRKTFCVGVDISRAYVEKAKRSHDYVNVDYVVCDVENLPFKAKSVDVVLCSEVLEHVLDYQHTILELLRVSKINFVVSFPGHTYIYKIARRVKPFKSLSEKLAADVGHISGVRVADLQKIVKGRCRSFRIEIAGALPLPLVKMIPSIRLVDAIDEILCSILKRSNMLEYATIHVIKITTC